MQHAARIIAIRVVRCVAVAAHQTLLVPTIRARRRTAAAPLRVLATHRLAAHIIAIRATKCAAVAAHQTQLVPTIRARRRVVAAVAHLRVLVTHLRVQAIHRRAVHRAAVSAAVHVAAVVAHRTAVVGAVVDVVSLTLKNY